LRMRATISSRWWQISWRTTERAATAGPLLAVFRA
jgi:hypothetical protein